MLLSLYVHLVPRALNATGLLWLVVFVAFFPLASVVARAGGINGLEGLGLNLSRAWLRQAFVGALIGTTAFLTLLVAEVATGTVAFIQWRQPGVIVVHLFQSMVVAVIGSVSNEIVTRGLVFAYFRDRLSPVLVMLVSTGLYVLDDSWNEGFNILNMAFSFVLGWAYSLSVTRTRSLSASSGLHAGWNLVYWIAFGFPGTASRGGVATMTFQPGVISPHYLGIAAALVVLIWTQFAIKSPIQGTPNRIRSLSE